MPNWCANSLQIVADEKIIEKIAKKLDETGGKEFFDIWVPNAGDREDWYSYNCDTYGCKWNCDAHTWDVDGEGTNITINFDSPWSPPVALYDTMSNELNVNLLAYYYEPGMCFAGKFEDGVDDFYDYSGMDSHEIEDYLPDDIDEMFAISEQERDREIEESCDED